MGLNPSAISTFKITGQLAAKDPKMAALGEDLLGIVNKLQDLVFNTIGNDSLDLPQIVTLSRNPKKAYLWSWIHVQLLTPS